jgi:peptidoglycan/LPS O-acetylase OafA/YrhL
MALYGYGLCAICSAIIILDLAAGSSSLLRRVLELRGLVWIGRISYGIYLWHYLVYHELRSFECLWSWRLLVVGGLLSIAVATTSFYAVERRFLRLKARFETRKKTPVAELATVGGAASELSGRAARDKQLK